MEQRRALDISALVFCGYAVRRPSVVSSSTNSEKLEIQNFMQTSSFENLDNESKLFKMLWEKYENENPTKK